MLRIQTSGGFILGAWHSYSVVLKKRNGSTAPRSRIHSAGILPGTVFDITLPVWRIGETLLQAQRLAQNLFEGPTTIKFIAIYEGLSGRSLTNIDHGSHVWANRIAHQNSITLNTHVDAHAIDTNHPPRKPARCRPVRIGAEPCSRRHSRPERKFSIISRIRPWSSPKSPAENQPPCTVSLKPPARAARSPVIALFLACLATLREI